jgi:hypothetical protein
LRNSSGLFRPHPNLSREVNRNIIQSEIEGGVRLEDLQPGSQLEVTTHNTNYQLLVLTGNVALITGNPLYCPHPVLVRIGPGVGEVQDEEVLLTQCSGAGTTACP